MTTDAVSRSSATGHNEEMIPRYTFGERANHWIGALSYTYLLFTGLAFWSPYLFWLAVIVGGGPTARFWHRGAPTPPSSCGTSPAEMSCIP